MVLPENALIPPLPHPPPAGGTCNGYLPSDTTLARFLWVVSFYAENEFYVLLDNHLREDTTIIDAPEEWARLWAELV